MWLLPQIRADALKIQHTGVPPFADYASAPVTYTAVPRDWQARKDIEFDVLRLDLGTRWAMGNKIFKLGNNLRQLIQDDVRRVLSFGGAWSNHLLALAQTAQAVGIESVGVVRGEEGFDNKMLGRMRSHGMRLHFISRSQYLLRKDPRFCQSLCQQLQCERWLPEGGSNGLAVAGCEEIARVINDASRDFTHVVAAVGTGATLAGIIRGCNPQQTVTGFPVVNDSTVSDQINHWVGKSPSVRWSLYRAGSVGSYARPSGVLLDFIVSFFASTGIALDPVYTGPAMFRALSAEFLGSLDSGARVVFVHTGGLAGVAGFTNRFTQCTNQEDVLRYFAHIETLVESVPA